MVAAPPPSPNYLALILLIAVTVAIVVGWKTGGVWGYGL